jgi:hypothetical protein
LGVVAIVVPVVLSGLLVGCDRMVAVYGVVQDSSAKPISDATVTLTVGKHADAAKTAADGSFRVGLVHVPRNADMKLTAVKAGYKASENHLRSTKNSETVVFKLESEPGTAADDFSITLERVGCVGRCPDYKVTILGSGSVQYEGRAYVRIEGIRSSTIPMSDVQKLVQELRDEDFLYWQEKQEVCVDFPEVHITAALKGQRKHVLEGCNSPGKVLELADEIDRISGAKRWVGFVR